MYIHFLYPARIYSIYKIEPKDRRSLFKHAVNVRQTFLLARFLGTCSKRNDHAQSQYQRLIRQGTDV